MQEFDKFIEMAKKADTYVDLYNEIKETKDVSAECSNYFHETYNSSGKLMPSQTVEVFFNKVNLINAPLTVRLHRQIDSGLIY